MEKQNLNEHTSDYGSEEEEQKQYEPQVSYRETFSVNNSFARPSISEKSKSFTQSASEIKWKYANFLGGTQEDNID